MAVEWDRGMNRISKFLSFVVVGVIHSHFIRIYRVTDNPDTCVWIAKRSFYKFALKSLKQAIDIHFMRSIIIFLIKNVKLNLFHYISLYIFNY